MRNTIVTKILSIVLIMVFGTTVMSSAAPNVFLYNHHGHDKIAQIKSHNNSSRSMSVQDLINRAHKKNNVTQTEVQVKTATQSKKKIVATTMIVSDARYFNIYSSTGEDKKVVGTLTAYEEVTILKAVGNYYKIDKGFINKKAVLTKKEYEYYTKRRGKLNTTMNKESNASISDIKKMISRYPRVKGMELTFLLCEKEYGINAIIMISCAIQESHLGESNIGRKKNNMFGIAAYDWDPFNCAKSFDTLADCLDYWCRLIIKGYFSEGRTSPAKMQPKYCTDTRWDECVEKIARQLVYKADK